MQNHLNPAHHRSNKSIFWIILLYATNLFFVSSPVWSTPIGETVISENTNWTAADNPYEVTGTVHVGSGATLTIEAGVVVKFAQGGFGIEVQDGAALVVEGGAASPVIFTDIRDDAAGGDTNGDNDGTSPDPGTWNGILVYDGGNLTLHYAHVRYAVGGISKEGVGLLDMENCIITSSLSDGLLLSFTDGENTISRCTFSENNQGIWIWGPSGNVTVESCIVSRNTYGMSIWDTFLGSVSLNKCTVSDNDDYGMDIWDLSVESMMIDLTGRLTVGVSVEDSTISGNSGAGISITNSSPFISNNTITANYTGIQCQEGATPSIGGSVENRNNILKNATFGVNNLSPDVMINATFNWWGDYLGPTHPSNTFGRGDIVSDYVDYDDFVQISALAGDLNNDNGIGIGDAVVGLQVISGMTPAIFHPEYALAGIDVNGDGRAGLAEVLFCIRGVAGFNE